MKKIMFALISLMTIMSSAYAIDQASIAALRKQGFEVQLGELTGAGSRMSLGRLAGFIHPRGIVMKADCKSIAISQASNHTDPKISDVTKVVVDQSVISASEFEGFFTHE
jgi:hypothetical protein